jgi:chemotaxis protein MotA
MIGFITGTCLLVWGMFDASNGDLSIYVSMSSIAIVIGGAFAALLISAPLSDVVALFRIMKKTILHKGVEPKQLITDIVSYAELARRDGILALENVTADIEFDFLTKGIRLAVDGTEPELIDIILNTELEYLSKRHATGKKMADLLGKYAPAFGMIGTLVGLIAMLANLAGNIDDIGPAMGVALITTLYGAVMANFIFMPIADKLETRSDEEKVIYEIVILGVMSIQQGDNPRIVQQKLSIFLPPSIRPAED